VSMPRQRDPGDTGATPLIHITERRSHVYLHIGTLNDTGRFVVVRDSQSQR
jgi:hypothetical protein